MKDRQIPKTGLKRIFNRECLWAYAFIAPILIGVLVFQIGPIFYSFYLSFTDSTGMNVPSFIGLSNYTGLLKNQDVVNEIRNTLLYTVTTVPVTLIISIFVATLLNKGLRGTGFFRVLFFLPQVTMPVAIALTWQSLFLSTGVINQLLGAVGLGQPYWISDPAYILWAIIIVSIWGGIGYNTVILLAGLQAISPTLYEAADIDGASEMVKFRKITIPLISPSIFFLLTMSIIEALKVFDIAYIFSRESVVGGSLLDRTRTLVYGIYRQGFHLNKMGLASAQSVFLFGIIVVVTIIQLRLQKKWVYYE